MSKSISVLMMGYATKNLPLIKEAYKQQMNQDFELLIDVNRGDYMTGRGWNNLLEKAKGDS